MAPSRASHKRRGVETRLDALRRCLQLYPSFPFAHFQMAMVYLARGTWTPRPKSSTKEWRSSTWRRGTQPVSGQRSSLACGVDTPPARRRRRCAL